MQEATQLIFPNTGVARAVRITDLDALPSALRELGLDPPRRVMVMVGGAGAMSDSEMAHQSPLFLETLVPLAQDRNLAVLDGGTDAGIMRLMGKARAEREATFPLIGIAAAGTVTLPNVDPPAGAFPLEPHHTGFVLVPGSKWGDESPWLSKAATVLAGGAPSVTVLVNGGEIAWLDIRHSVEANRPVIAIAGSGRTADELAAAARGSPSSERAKELVGSGLIHSIDLNQGAHEQAAAIEAILLRKERAMSVKNSYRDWLKQDLGELIAALDLTDLQKHFLRSRWLDQVIWMEGRADSMSSRYHRLRVITVVGSTLIPGLLSALFLTDTGSISQLTIHVIILVVSLLVAILVAVEEFFHFGERWRHYRRTVEGLKTEGWQFFQLSGPYRAKSHAEAYPSFAGRVEEILQQDIEGYIKQVVGGKEEEQPKPTIV